MSVTAAPAFDHDICQLPAYLGMKDDCYLTAGPDGKFIAQQILSFRQRGQPVFSLEPLTQYSDLERKLVSMLNAAENDDFGPVRPSLTAVQGVRELLLEIAASGYVVPSPEDVDTDHDGQIRIAWRKGGRFLELVAPYEPSESRYIYHSEDSTFNIEPIDSSEVLKNWLNWMR
jgi:hypothetical protein